MNVKKSVINIENMYFPRKNNSFVKTIHDRLDIKVAKDGCPDHCCFFCKIYLNIFIRNVSVKIK